MCTPCGNPLCSYENAKRQAKQNGINADWLRQIIDEIHFYLCPNENGTWQDRAKQALAAARKISST